MNNDSSHLTTYNDVKEAAVHWNPCRLAVSRDMLDVVQVLEIYKEDQFRCLETLRCAVQNR